MLEQKLALYRLALELAVEDMLHLLQEYREMAAEAGYTLEMQPKADGTFLPPSVLSYLELAQRKLPKEHYDV